MLKFEQKHFDCGKLEVANGNVRVYYTSSNYSTLNTPQDVISAHWEGASIIVECRSGHILRYTAFDSYDTIR